MRDPTETEQERGERVHRAVTKLLEQLPAGRDQDLALEMLLEALLPTEGEAEAGEHLKAALHRAGILVRVTPEETLRRLVVMLPVSEAGEEEQR